MQHHRARVVAKAGVREHRRGRREHRVEDEGRRAGAHRVAHGIGEAQRADDDDVYGGLDPSAGGGGRGTLSAVAVCEP